MADTPTKRKIKVPKVVNGIESIVEIEVDDTAGPQWGNRDQFAVIGKRLPRVDGPEKVSGRAKYTHDVRVPGMLYGRILPSPHASAKVTSIDTSAAEALKGVVAVIANSGKKLRYQGDPVAAVAAETPELAEDGIRAIKVTYDVQPHVVDFDAATADGAAAIYGAGNIRAEAPVGDAAAVDARLAACAAVVEGEFRTPMQHHASFETHGVVVDYSGGDSATVYASTQGTFGVQGDAARALGLDQSKVVSIVQHMGGGFGAKNGLDLPGSVAAQLSLKAKRPVHLMLTRADEFLMGGNRSGSVQRLKLGASADGKLLAMKAEQHKMGGIGGGTQRGQPFMYHVETVYRTMDSVHTNFDSSRAFRAPGCPQASFAMESILDDLAAKLNMDPIDLRKANIGGGVHVQQLDKVAGEIGWATGRNKQPGAGQIGVKKRGMGIGISGWGGGGGPNCRVTVNVAPSGAVTVKVGSQDLGTGTRTYVAAIAAEEFGLPIGAVDARIGDSRLGNAGGSGGSTTTASLAPAVKDAAFSARVALFARIAAALDAKPEDLAASNGKVVTAAGKSVTWKQACALLGSSPVEATGQWKIGLSDSGTHGVQAAEVEVDTETGKVRVLRMVGVQDCGLALNRLAVESQLNGGMIQSLGYALTEGNVVDRLTGVMLNNSFEDYKLPGTMEMPDFTSIIDDTDKRGVIGMAEPATIPGAGVIANAIFNACGVRVRTLPITPDKILAGLAELKKQKGGAA